MKRLILIIVAILFLIGGAVGFYFYNRIYSPNTIKEGFVYIASTRIFDEVKKDLQPYLKNMRSFEWVAAKKNYQNTIKPGKYQIKKGLNNNELVDLLRSGQQVPVNISFNNQDDFGKLAGRISSQIEADSLDLYRAFTEDNFLGANGFDQKTGLAMYIPNTYEFFWNTSAEAFRNRMYNEYKAFWNDNRSVKAKRINLTPTEVVTLASIVQKETALIEERPVVAKLYLNRLKDNWPLQADPTIIFAMNLNNEENIKIRRVLYKDLEIESPYNTYKYAGLPPGPIGMPDISSIDAVLNPSNHNYYYMCASIEQVGKHEFASTLSQHNKNASKYQNWLNKQGIRR